MRGFLPTPRVDESPRPLEPPGTAMQKLRIVILRFGTRRDRKGSLNDGQIQTPLGAIVERAAI
jgi:hypothetical protein